VSIEVRHITKIFGYFKALKDVSLTIPTGELVALLGPSGSGKTTLLRIIAGLEVPEGGSVFLDGEDATDRSASRRKVGLVFQHYALFRHMTVFENVAFGLKVRPRKVRLPRGEIKAKVHKLLSLVQLESLASRYPSQLSGGQRQRVALARALAVEPKVLLLDEPFGALDAKLRKELRRWLRRLHDELHTTSVFVTHDQEEALEVADHVVVMNEGQVEQVGTPEEVYNRPATPFVMNFLGNVNIFHARLEGDKVSLAAGLEADAPLYMPGGGQNLMAFVRPHEMDLDLTENGKSSARARVKWINSVGSTVKVELELLADNKEVEVELTRQRYEALNLSVGKTVYVTPKELKVFANNYYI